jgi:hypothetical protein
MLNNILANRFFGKRLRTYVHYLWIWRMRLSLVFLFATWKLMLSVSSNNGISNQYLIIRYGQRALLRKCRKFRKQMTTSWIFGKITQLFVTNGWRLLLLNWKTNSLNVHIKYLTEQKMNWYFQYCVKLVVVK